MFSYELFDFSTIFGIFSVLRNFLHWRSGTFSEPLEPSRVGSSTFSAPFSWNLFGEGSGTSPSRWNHLEMVLELSLHHRNLLKKVLEHFPSIWNHLEMVLEPSPNFWNHLNKILEFSPYFGTISRWFWNLLVWKILGTDQNQPERLRKDRNLSETIWNH